jgi:hypothetical protein
MRLPGVYIDVQDGGLGMVPTTAEGVHAKVGTCSLGTVNQIAIISDPASVATVLGTGPLADAVLDSMSSGSSTILAVKANGDVASTIGDISSTKTGTGNITAAGSPLDAYEVKIVITKDGQRNGANFKISLDGGDNYSQEITVPATPGTYVISDTGITLTFTDAEATPENSFKVNDTYAFTTTAPGASVNSVNAAIDVLLQSKNLFEFIHVVGPSDDAMWAALAVKATAAATNRRYIHIIAEARGPEPDESIDEWVAALQEMRGSFSSTRVSVVAGRNEMIDQATGRSVERNGAGLFAGRCSKIKVKTSPGKVEDGPIDGVIGLRPLGIKEGHILVLDQGGFITFRQYIGKNGHYITNGRIMADSTSDFQYTELRRTMDKACALVYAAALNKVQSEATAGGIKDLEVRLSAALNNMASDTVQEIVSGRVVIPPNQNILAGMPLQAVVKIVPVGIMREIDIEIGFENPFNKATTK